MEPPYRALTVKYNGVARRITTRVGLAKACTVPDPSHPPAPQFETDALWDTGATNTVVTRATAEALGLVATGRAKVQHAGGEGQSNTYIVYVYLPHKVLIMGVPVAECPDTVGGFGAIIGMDIIVMGDLAITNCDKQTWMTYRFPSVGALDFVEEFNRLKYTTGPNDPCPCGKKGADGRRIPFRKCHGRKGA